MPEFVAKITWEAVHTQTNDTEGGTRLVSLEDVSIIPQFVTRESKLITQETSIFSKTPEAFKEVEKLTEIITRIQRENSPEELSRVEETFFKKSLALGKYRLGYSEHPGSNRLGFGLFGDIEGEKTFCWEWFNLRADGSAKKLQETGEIKISTTSTDEGEQISHMAFLTPVSLRILPFAPPAMQLEPSWRLNIGAGSEIYWPTLRDNKIVSSGFV
jgi:hypothetical protein